MASEKNFENRVKDFLKNQGCWFIKYWGGGQFTKEGIPDILCCCDGHFLGIEIKAPKGRPSPLQIHNLKKIDEAGGYGILLYPKDFDSFKFFIKLLSQGDTEFLQVYKLLKGRWEE
jgi:Holliday junction resolvase